MFKQKTPAEYGVQLFLGRLFGPQIVANPFWRSTRLQHVRVICLVSVTRKGGKHEKQMVYFGFVPHRQCVDPW
jgi:hypothetical protein